MKGFSESAAIPNFSSVGLIASDHEILKVLRQSWKGKVHLAGDIFSLSELARQIKRDGFSSAILFSLNHALTVERLRAVQSAFEVNQLQIGFITGRTLKLLAWSFSKALAERETPETTLQVHDFVDFCFTDASSDFEALKHALATPCQTMIIRSHGEGSHAKLPGLTICGLLDEVEFPETPELGCSVEGRRCKRKPKLPGDRVLFGQELQSQTVFFLCCNGLNLAGELFPSPVSIAQSLTEGSVTNLVAPYRSVIVPDSLVTWLSRRVATGGRLIDIVAELNDKSSLLAQGRPFLLLGNPEQVLEPDTSEEISFVSPQIELSAGNLRTDLEERCNWFGHLLENHRRVSRVLDSIKRSSNSVDTRLIARSLEEIHKLGVSGLKQSQQGCFASELKDIDRTIALLKVLVQRADAKLAHIIVGARKWIDPYDLFHHDQLRAGCERAGPCDRCGTRLIHEYYTDFGSKRPDRCGVFCEVCGPKSEHRPEFMQLCFHADRKQKTSVNQDTLRMKLDIRFPQEPLVAFAQISVRFFDKAADLCLVDFDETVDVLNGQWEAQASLEIQPSADLHSLRTVLFCGLEFGYVRCRVPGGPMPRYKSAKR